MKASHKKSIDTATTVAKAPHQELLPPSIYIYHNTKQHYGTI